MSWLWEQKWLHDMGNGETAILLQQHMELSHSCYRSWSPDRTMSQARKYIADSMGRRYADAVLLDLEATWSESNPRVPLVCFLSMGSDPTSQIEGLAKKLHVGKWPYIPARTEPELHLCCQLWTNSGLDLPYHDIFITLLPPRQST